MGNGTKPTDSETLAQIRDLVTEEKTLRAQLQHHDITESEEHNRLRRVEIELDQCWDSAGHCAKPVVTQARPRCVRPTRSRAIWARRGSLTSIRRAGF